jgi:hypothetical protein
MAPLCVQNFVELTFGVSGGSNMGQHDSGGVLGGQFASALTFDAEESATQTPTLTSLESKNSFRPEGDPELCVL